MRAIDYEICSKVDDHCIPFVRDAYKVGSDTSAAITLWLTDNLVGVDAATADEAIGAAWIVSEAFKDAYEGAWNIDSNKGIPSIDIYIPEGESTRASHAAVAYCLLEAAQAVRDAGVEEIDTDNPSRKETFDYVANSLTFTSMDATNSLVRAKNNRERRILDSVKLVKKENELQSEYMSTVSHIITASTSIADALKLDKKEVLSNQLPLIESLLKRTVQSAFKVSSQISEIEIILADRR